MQMAYWHLEYQFRISGYVHTIYTEQLFVPLRKAIRYSMSSNDTELKQAIYTHRTTNIEHRTLLRRQSLVKSSPLDIYFRLSGFQSSLCLFIHFLDGPNECTHCTKVWYKNLIRYVTLHFRDQRAQLRSVTEIAPKLRLLCVNRSPIQYDFLWRRKSYSVQCEQNL